MSGERTPTWWFPATLVLGAAVLLPLAWVGALHCDEANVLRHVTSFGHGDYSAPGRPGLLWLALTPFLHLGDPATVVLAIRLSAVAASVAGLFLVGRLAARAAGPAAAPLAVILLLSSMSWVGHAFEIRTDTYVLPLTLGAMLLLWRPDPSLRAAVGAGLLLAAAGLVSQKSIYNAASVAAGCAVIAALQRDPRILKKLVVAAGVAAGGAALWYAGLAAVQADGGVATNLAHAASNAFDDPRPLRTNVKAWGKAAGYGHVLYITLVLGLLLVPRRIARARSELATATLAAVAAAFLVLGSTLFFHRGFFLYFIASFEPYAAVLAAAGVLALAGRLPALRPGWVLAALLVAGAWYASNQYGRYLDTDNGDQLRLLRDVAEAYPEPVPYWDSAGIVAGYPETTFFGTRRNRKRNRARLGEEMYLDLARAAQPRFYVRNYLSRASFFGDVERRWMRSNYVPWRGNLHVRGGRAPVHPDGVGRARFELLDPGPHTVHLRASGEARITLDGVPVDDGATVELTRGPHTLTTHGAGADGEVWLLPARLGVPDADTIDDLQEWSLYPVLSRRRKQRYDRPKGDQFLLTPPGDPSLRRETEQARSERLERHRVYQEELRLGDWGQPGVSPPSTSP